MGFGQRFLDQIHIRREIFFLGQ